MYVLAEIAKETDSGHVNQVFPTAGYTQGLLEGSGANNTLVNALISPTGTVGKVIISTGPFSSKNNIVADIDDALLMLRDCTETYLYNNALNRRIVARETSIAAETTNIIVVSVITLLFKMSLRIILST